MRNLLPEFGLDTKTIEVDRGFCAGLAAAYLRSAEVAKTRDQRDIHLAAGATNYRRAGAHCILLGESEEASRLFEGARRAYSALGSPYSLLMSAFGTTSDDFVFERLHTEKQFNIPTRKQLVYALLFGAARGLSKEDEPMSQLRAELRASHSSTIGVLGLRIGVYVDLFDNLNDDNRLKESLLPFLVAFNSAIKWTRQNAYHWRNLAVPFHPAEPDIVGVLILVQRSLLRGQRSVLQTLEELPLSPIARQILTNALRQFPGSSQSPTPAAA